MQLFVQTLSRTTFYVSSLWQQDYKQRLVSRGCGSWRYVSQFLSLSLQCEFTRATEYLLKCSIRPYRNQRFRNDEYFQKKATANYVILRWLLFYIHLSSTFQLCFSTATILSNFITRTIWLQYLKFSEYLYFLHARLPSFWQCEIWYWSA